MNTNYTEGKWIYNPDNLRIESDVLDEDGDKLSIINCYGAFGSEDIDADIRLICAAPIMFELLREIKQKVNLDNILLEKINEIIKSVK